MSKLNLPIEPILPQIEAALQSSGAAVLSAEPGAGKTTCVPPFLLPAPWLAGKKIIMLEPRRLAAKTAARFIASKLGEVAGETIGYRIRGESKVSQQTKIEIVTEGILVRMIQDDPGLEDVGLVIFDEFHERSIHADLGLALTLEIRRTIREDLRLLVMSATIESDPIAALIGGEGPPAPVIHATGRAYPVEIRHLGDDDFKPVEARTASAVVRALREVDGDILVFLPGRAEIARTIERLAAENLPPQIEVLPLSSEVGEGDERRVLTPAAAGKRKVIVATNIAETSLTIDGVRAVVDSGLMRVSLYDPVRAMAGLKTVSVSLASATQRAGRAGRQAPGICYRLWSPELENSLPRFNAPEITQSDLTPLALELALWGDPLGQRLALPTPPPRGVLDQARGLLFDLGAVDPAGAITPHGREIAKIGVHPRLAHSIIYGAKAGLGAEACDAAALLEERDIFPGRSMGGGNNSIGTSGKDIDLGSRYAVLLHFRRTGKSGGLSRGGLQRVEQQAQTMRRLTGERGEGDLENLGTVLGFAFPDRIGMRRADDPLRFVLRNGIGAAVPRGSVLSKERFIVAAHLDGGGANARVFLGEPISEEAVRRHFSELFTVETDVRWDDTAERITANEVEKFGAIELAKRPARAGAEQRVEIWGQQIERRGINYLNWTPGAAQFRKRAEWLRLSGSTSDGWPVLDDRTLVATTPTWLGPFLGSVSSRSDLQSVDLDGALRGVFSWDQLQQLERLAPARIDLPSGSVVTVDYATEPPSISAILQEFLGQRTTPQIGRGISLTVHILSPARRPLQVTRDLESFWKNSYREVRKEMAGRYPKHFWPEDPLSEMPMQKSRKKRQ